MSIVVDTPTIDETITETQEVQETTENIQEDTVSDNVEVDGNIDPEIIETPKKYAGKSLEDVIEMHQHVEKALGKQGAEVGEQRKLIQTLLESQNGLEHNATIGQTEEEVASFEDRLYEDPAKAVNSAIENHPDVVKAKEERVFQEQQRKLSVLEKAYPEWKSLVEDEGFKDWVGDSEIRIDMFRKADSEYKPEYAIELFDTYNKINMIDRTKEVQEQETAKRDKALRKTISETRSSSSVGGKKMYRRADLINLQITDPRRYEALADEIQSAYAEGRVR